MKKSKFYAILLGFVLVITSCFCVALIGKDNSTNNRAYAQYTTETYQTNDIVSKNALTISDGNIPVSLFTSKTLVGGTASREITDYYPAFNTYKDTNGVSYYIMDESSAPYILLSSQNGVSGEILNDLYNTNLNFIFNNSAAKNESSGVNYGTINRESGALVPYLTIQNSTSSTPIILKAIPDITNQNDTSYTFSLNLQSLFNGEDKNSNALCPILGGSSSGGVGTETEEEFLGGNTGNDISARTGLYTIRIEFNYSLGTKVSNKCIFSLSFYVVDYSNYLQEGAQKPLRFENTTIYTNEDEEYTKEHQIYNYNYLNAPIIKYDATKFAMNFDFKVGNSELKVYNFEYTGFSKIENKDYNGIITLYCSQLDKNYYIYTYQNTEDELQYEAIFDLKDFENNFILPNSSSMQTSVFQGIFDFSLDLLTEGSNQDVFIQISNDLFSTSVTDNLTCQELVIFGFDLRYEDKDPNSATYNKSLSLSNDYTFNNISAYNSTTQGADTKVVTGTSEAEENGNFINIPNKIPTTNCAPLRFHSFGNLSNGATLYQAQYKLYSNSTANENSLIGSLNEITNTTDFDAIINDGAQIYSQFASFTSDGIYFIKLNYSINIPITTITESEGTKTYNTTQKAINGCQYVLFSINNSTQNLYIHSLDSDNYYDFNSYTNKNVRVAVEEKSNLFALPTIVTYTLSTSFDNNQTSSGTLVLKKNLDGSNESYVINGITYNYYTLSSTVDYTFSVSGRYTVSIKKVGTGASSRKYTFSIDKNQFTDIKVNEVKTNGSGEYVKDKEVQSSNLSFDFLSKNLYVTNSAFTLSWAEKSSNAKSYVYVAFMELMENTSGANSLFKQSNGDYWLTNNYYFDNVTRNSETSYENSYDLAILNANNYFKKEGLYYFYIYDQAGNSTSLTVLLDNSTPAIVQGSWQGSSEASEWQDSFNPSTNPSNYINQDTVLYFGSHKALALPNLDSGDELIQLNDISYTKSYSKTDGAFNTIKQPISFYFYQDILKNLSDYIQATTGLDLFNRASESTPVSNYYLILPNTQLEYIFEPSENNPREHDSGIITQSLYRTVVYSTENVAFSGEAHYVFTIKNSTGSYATREISMSFENTKFNFFAYDTSDDLIYINKNSGTNLNSLGFDYIITNNDQAIYYQIQTLTYDYYPFVLDINDPRFSTSSYPFASTPDSANVALVAQQIDSQTYRVMDINATYSSTSTSSMTKPGKYIIKRIYRGGGYTYDPDTNSIVQTKQSDEQGYYGGEYYLNSEGDYVQLFQTDKKERSYVIYVDHNEILSPSLNTYNKRDVGDNITIKLNNNVWTFKDFYKITNNSSYLITNEIPLTINIPVSKYFAITDKASSGYIFNNINFARLNVEITHIANDSKVTRYIVDGYDTTTGYCTCSSLASNNNPKGYLMFENEGTYQVLIYDNTGYSDLINNALTLNNNPTSFTFSFQVKYSSPFADGYSYIYNRNNARFEEITLLDENSTNTYSTNAYKNSGLSEEILNNNQLYIKWADSRTPYLARVNYINIAYFDGNSIKNFTIDLTNKQLNEIADGNLLIVVDKSFNIRTINSSALDQDDFVVYLVVEYYNSITHSETFDSNQYYRYKYTLYFDMEKESNYQVDLCYYSTSSRDFTKTTYNLVIDRTKPNANLDNLISNEDFLKTYYSSTLNSFKEENFNIDNINNLPCNLTYSFGVSQQFILNYNQTETVPYFYVRKYNNYQGEYASITPDMANTQYYQNDNIFSNYPKFSELTLINGIINIGTNTYYQINYSTSESLYNLIAQATTSTPSGYYEIIEKDNAGNYRTFTIYYPPTDIKILEVDGKDEDRISFEASEDKDLTANMYFEISKLSSLLGWGMVTIKNQTLDTQFDGTIKLTPYTYVLTDNLLTKLNNFFNVSLDSKFTFTLSKYNASFPIYSRSVSIITNQSTAKLPAPTISEVVEIATNTTYYNISLPAYSDKAVLYLTSLTIKKYSQEMKVWQNLYVFNTKEEVKDHNPITKLSRGTYKVIYTDNYNTSSYEYNLYVGEYRINSFDKEVNFDNNYIYDEENEVYYTGGNFNLTYEANIYTVYVNGVLYSGTNKEQDSQTLGSKNCKTINLNSNYSYENIQANRSVGGNTEYIVNYYDITDNTLQKQYKFVIYDYLPQILLSSADGSSEISSTTFESSSQITNSAVKVNWGEIDNSDYDLLNDSSDNEVSVAYLYTKANIDDEYSTGVKISRNQLITTEGYYKLEIKNQLLGNSRYVYFVIQFGEFPLYTVMSGDVEIAPSPYETLDLSNNQTNYSAYFNETSTSQSLIYVIYQALSQMKDNGQLLNIIDRNKTEFDLLVEGIGFRNGVFAKDNVSIANVTNVNHYYSIQTMTPIYNSNIDLNVIEFVFKNSTLLSYYLQGTTNSPIPNSVGEDYYTTIYLVFSLNGPIRIEFFATTKTPTTNNLLSNTIYYESNGAINLSINKTEAELTNAEITGNNVTIGWNSIKSTNQNTIYWYNCGNYIYCLEQYGTSNRYKKLDFNYDSSYNRNYSILYNAGSHKLKFMDLAGNIHLFSLNSLAFEPDTYTIHLITQVIYHIDYNNNQYNPIQNAVFNNDVKIVIDEYYMRKLTGLSLQVTRNGVNYTNYNRTDNEITFSEAGKYVVVLRASHQNRDLNPATYTFTLLSTSSARLAYEFPEVTGYEIIKVLRDNQDITSNFVKNGKISSLFISSTDSRSGNGYYTVTLKYGEDASDILEFSFLISNYVPSITCNINYGETTTSNIEISYNPSYIYNQLGNCYIKVLVYNEDSGTFSQYGKFTIDQNTTSSLTSFTLSQSASYFIQVETESGNTISSFRVNKTDPLNTFAIIIIIVSVIAVIALVIVVIKLRTRMRVK